MINAHKGDHVLIAVNGTKLQCVEVIHANRRYITAGENKFYRTTGNPVGGGDWKGEPYIVRKVSPERVQFVKEHFGGDHTEAEFNDVRVMLEEKQIAKAAPQ